MGLKDETTRNKRLLNIIDFERMNKTLEQIVWMYLLNSTYFNQFKSIKIWILNI
jgi:hypothetical protein